MDRNMTGNITEKITGNTTRQITWNIVGIIN